MKFSSSLIALLFVINTHLNVSDAQSAEVQQNLFLRGSTADDAIPTSINEPCTLLGKELEYENDVDEFSWECELDPVDAGGKEGIILAIEGYDLPKHATNHIGESLRSGISTMFVPGMEIIKSNNKARVRVPPGVTPGFGRRPEKKRRKLAITEGIKPVLVVRINAADTSTTASPAALSDSVFGTSGDPINLKTQYADCSHDKVNVVAGGNPASASLPVIDGVVEVTIPDTIAGADRGTIRNAVTNALTSNGFSLPGNYHHIMYCLPPGTAGGWIAYAYINHWNSVYNDQWCTYLSSQMHEIGHNLNLAHAGEGTNNYGDQSGMMGYSYSQDDGPQMCFNGPKMWQLGWFSDRQATVDALISSWTGDLVGAVDYLNSVGKFVILKINTSSDVDYYVTFNRKSGFNYGTQEGGDQVLVTAQGGEGTGYSQSNLVAILDSGNSYSIDNFGGSGQTVTITVNGIFTADFPPRANVEVSGPTPTPPPTSPPTQPPTTSLPTTALPTQPPTTATPTPLPTQGPPTQPPTTPPPTTSPPTQSPTTTLPTQPPTITPPTSPPTPPPTAPPTHPPTTSLPTTTPPTQPPTTATPTPPPTEEPPTPPPTTPPPTTKPPTQPPTTALPTQLPTTTPPTSPPTLAPTCLDLQPTVTYLKKNGRATTEACTSVNQMECEQPLTLQGGFVFEICQATCSQYTKVIDHPQWLNCISPYAGSAKRNN